MPIDNFSSPFAEKPYNPTPNVIANNDEHFAAYETTVSHDSLAQHRAQVEAQYVAGPLVTVRQETAAVRVEESPADEMMRQMENLSDTQLVEYIVTMGRYQTQAARGGVLSEAPFVPPVSQVYGARSDYDLAA